jgi:hypothetical protein
MYIIDEWADERHCPSLARDKNNKCIFFGTYKTKVKNEQSLGFFIIISVTNIQTVYKIVTKGTNIIVRAFFPCQIKNNGLFDTWDLRYSTYILS